MKFLLKFLPTLIVTVCLGLGCLYSIHNTDPHHWGFILSTALDHLQGKAFFTETYIQYGVGQALLFRLTDFFFTVNYTGIGIITSFVYSLSLLILFLTLKKKSTFVIAFVFTGLAFLLHPYSIYPWPDYFAGLSLILASACYFLQQKPKSPMLALLCGALIFLSFLFRNTYLLGIFSASLVYFALNLFIPKLRDRFTQQSLMAAWSLILLYFGFLSFQGNLSLWFAQTIGAGSTTYGITWMWILNLVRRVLFPTEWITGFVSLLFYFGVYATYLAVFKKKNIQLLFITLLGMAGIVQATMGFEMFRLQNSCMPLYLIAGLMIAQSERIKSQHLFRKTAVGLVAAYALFLITQFPKASALFPLYEGPLSDRHPSTIPLFLNHRFNAEEETYYRQVIQFACDARHELVNLTMDATLPFLCTHQKRAWKLPFYSDYLSIKTNPVELQEKEKGIFKEGQIVITDRPIATNPSIQLLELGQAKRPDSIRFLHEAIVHIYLVQIVADKKID